MYANFMWRISLRRGMRASAQKAQHAGGAHPLGYTVDENKKYIIDPKHAPTVRLIFEMYSAGKTITEIVNELNSRGIRTPKGKLFTFNSLNKVLKNKKYIGIYTYKDEIVIEDAIPPILDKELFYKVQEMLRVNQKAAAHRKAKVDYLLFGKLFCGKCGTMMVGVCGTSKTGARHHYYFLHQLTDMDLQGIDCQKRLIKTFINSVFVYDDKVILTFNYSSDHRTIMLKEIEAGLQECVRISPSDVHQRITVILIQRNDGYFIPKISILGTFRE